MLSLSSSNLVFKGDQFNPGRFTSVLMVSLSESPSFPQGTERSFLFKVRTNFPLKCLSVSPNRGILSSSSSPRIQMIFILDLEDSREPLDLSEKKVQIVYTPLKKEVSQENMDLCAHWAQVPKSETESLSLLCKMDDSTSIFDILDNDEPTKMDILGESTRILDCPMEAEAPPKEESGGDMSNVYRDRFIFICGALLGWFIHYFPQLVFPGTL